MIPINNKSIIETTELYYIGYDKDANSLLPFKAKQIKLDTLNPNNRNIEFQGEAKQGYSGGPVINNKGEVVAVLKMVVSGHLLIKSKNEMIPYKKIICSLANNIKERL